MAKRISVDLGHLQNILQGLETIRNGLSAAYAAAERGDCSAELARSAPAMSQALKGAFASLDAIMDESGQ